MLIAGASAARAQVIGGKKLKHGDVVMMNRDGKDVKATVVYQDAKGGNLYVRTAPGKAPFAVAANAIRPAAGAEEKGGIVPGVGVTSLLRTLAELPVPVVFHLNSYWLIYAGSPDTGQSRLHTRSWFRTGHYLVSMVNRETRTGDFRAARESLAPPKLSFPPQTRPPLHRAVPPKRKIFRAKELLVPQQDCGAIAQRKRKWRCAAQYPRVNY